MRCLIPVSIALTTSLTLFACGGSSPGGDNGSVISPAIGAATPNASVERQLVIEDNATPEGSAADSGVARFNLSLSSPAETTVSVMFTTVAGDAAADVDFQSTSGSTSIAAGETTGFIEVPLLGDADAEPAERFSLVLSNPQGATLARTAATGTIANDDSACDGPATINPWLERRIINFSHRGGAADYPENTLYSYKQSVLIGAEVLEMDIYETADGELVVIHDDSVDRTTEASGAISGYTLAQLKELDAAHNFVPNRGAVSDAVESEYIFRGVATGEQLPPAGFTANDFRIPTLDETLALFPDALINIELKPDPNGTGSYEAKLATLLLNYGRQGDVLVASFVDAPSSLFKAAAPCISTSFPTGQAAATVTASQGPGVIAPRTIHDAYQVPRSLGIEVVTQDFVDNAHASGHAVHVFTINDCQEMVDLLNLDVDAIMTDRPNLLEALLAQPEGEWSCTGLQ